MATETDPTPNELALICQAPASQVEEAMARTGISAHRGRLTAAEAIRLAEALEVDEMGRVGVKLAEMARLRAGSPEDLDAALDAIDEALTGWLERHPCGTVPSFLAEARRVLPEALYRPVAQVWENPGRGQQAPHRH